PSPPRDNPWPPHLLRDILWSLSDTRIATRAELEAELKERHEDTETSFPDMDAIVLAAPAVYVTFFPWDDAIKDRDDTSVLLEASDPRGFAAGELLWKIHNAVAASLSPTRRLGDHCYFEGLQSSTPGDDGVPQYSVITGS